MSRGDSSRFLMSNSMIGQVPDVSLEVTEFIGTGIVIKGSPTL